MGPASIVPTTPMVESVNDVNLVTMVMPLLPRTVQVSKQAKVFGILSPAPVST